MPVLKLSRRTVYLIQTAYFSKTCYWTSFQDPMFSQRALSLHNFLLPPNCY